MTTPINNIPLPSLTSPANIETSIHPMANAIDSLVVSRFTTLAARDAAIGEPAFGQVCSVSDTEEIYYWNGGAWVSLTPRVKFLPSHFVFSNTTFTDVPDMFFTVEANSFYYMHFLFRLNVVETQDAKFAFTFPSGATCTAHWEAFTPTGSNPYPMAQPIGITLVSGSQPQDGFFRTTADGEGLVHELHLFSSIGATAGTIQLRFACQANSGTEEMQIHSFAESWKRA